MYRRPPESTQGRSSAASDVYKRQPLRTLNATAARFAEGDLQVRPIDDSAPPEIEALAHTLNRMAERLDELLAEQRLFVADASHQLKTPVAVLRAGLEELRAAGRFPAETDEEISRLVHQTYRLSGVIDDLLLLSRLDAGRLRLSLEPVELTRLIEAALDDYKAGRGAFEARIQMRVSFPMQLQSLRSGLSGWQYYDLALELVDTAGVRQRIVHLDYVYSSTCPCSLELSEHARRNRGRWPASGRAASAGGWAAWPPPVASGSMPAPNGRCWQAGGCKRRVAWKSFCLHPCPQRASNLCVRAAALCPRLTLTRPCWPRA